MGTTIRKIFILTAACLMIATTFTGCKPSKKKVESSSYYKELNKKYKKLKKENKELTEELASKDEPTEDEQRASDYLGKIARDRIISIEVGYADNMAGSELITDNVVFTAATAIAKRADLTGKYTPEEVKKKFGPGYEYVLYDEDNAVYEIMVYGGDYVVFTDLPNNVYYAYHASALGDAFLHYKEGYPNSRLLHRLADSSLVSDGNNCYENDSACRAANYIRTMERKNSSRKKADKEWLKAYLAKNNKKKKKETEESRSEDDSGEDSDQGEESTQAPAPEVYEPEGDHYTFYHHGNVMVMTLYDEFICIKNMDEKETWYKVDKSEVDALKKLFVVPEEETVDGTRQESAATGTQADQSHEKEIEEESNASQNNE